MSLSIFLIFVYCLIISFVIIIIEIIELTTLILLPSILSVFFPIDSPDESLSSAITPPISIDKTLPSGTEVNSLPLAIDQVLPSAIEANSFDLSVEVIKDITFTGDSLGTNSILSTASDYAPIILVTGLVIGGLYYLSPYLYITVSTDPSTRSAIANLAIDAVVGLNNAVYSIIDLFRW